MGINATVTRLQDGRWQFVWTPGTPPYDVWLDGKRLAEALATELFIDDGSLFSDEASPLEILNAGDTPENERFPPRIILQWRALQTATGYVVERFLDAVFVEDGQFMETGRGYEQYESVPLADDTIHTYRVIALDLQANEGVPLTFSIDMVRNPAPPDVVCTIDTAGDVVVSAA